MEKEDNIPKPEEGKPEEPELTYEEQTEKDFHKNPSEEEIEEWEW